ncbi:hypothetical protein FGRMN_7005 [Fusarium graminum]|nr:hypothetical protein FGRMN_7005 [Fusarium graminum]
MSPSLASEAPRYNDCSLASASEDEDDSPDPLNGAAPHHGLDFSIRETDQASSVKDTMKRALRASSRLGDGVRYQQLGVSNDLDAQSPPVERTAFEFGSSHETLSFFGHVRSTIVASKLNWLLIFVPIGLAAHSFEVNPLVIFMTNAIAIVPLSVMLTEATERIAADAGDTIGALLNITLGNLVELIIFVALVNDHIRIVQASILGSVLVNLLLILGSALCASSVSGIDPHSSIEESELLAALLFVSVFVILIPTAFDYTFHMKGKPSEAALSMSRASALVVLVIYIVYFAHEMRGKTVDAPAIPLQTLHADHHTHRRNQNSTSHGSRLIRFVDQDVPTRARSTTLDTSRVAPVREPSEDRGKRETGRRTSLSHRSRGNSRSHSRSGSRTEFHGSELRDLSVGGHQRILPELPEVPNHTPYITSSSSTAAAVTVLVFSSALMSMNAEFLVKTIDDVTHEGGLSEALIGLIILPVVGNIAEYVTVVTVAMRNKLELAISVAVGSAIQIALCVAPLTVLIAWMLGRDLEMAFNVFETTTLVGSGLLINLLILSRAGTAIRAIGLKGALMFACYIIIRWQWLDEKYVAIKVKTRKKSSKCSSADNEVKIMRRIAQTNPKHKGWQFVRKLIDTFPIEGISGNHTCLVLEPLREPLWLYCSRYAGGVIPPEILKILVQMILHALDYLHSECSIIHTDLNPDNIMIKIEDPIIFHRDAKSEFRRPLPEKQLDDRTIYLSRDNYGPLTKPTGIIQLVGFDRAVPTTPGELHTGAIQNKLYRAPEVVLNSGYTYSADIWSLGVLLWDALEGKSLFSPLTFPEVDRRDQET